LCIIANHKNRVGFTNDTSFMLSTLDRSVADTVDVYGYVKMFCNSTDVSKGKVEASDDGNIVGGVSNYLVIDKEKCADGDECVVEVKKANESELIGKGANSIDAAFEVYNEYAFRKRFSVRCYNLRRREDL